MATKRGQAGRFRCDECRRALDVQEDGGDDCGASHWFCHECLARIENRAAVVAARIERRQGMQVSNTALFWLASVRD